MTNKISFEEYSKAVRETRNELEKFANELSSEKRFRRCVEINIDHPYGGGIHSEVNWAAIGSVPAEEAVKFAQLLTKAAELAQNFKYNGYKVYYTDED